VILVLIGFLAFGCGDSAGNEAAPSGGGTALAGSSTTVAPKRGGTITHGVYSETAGLDPVVSNGGGTTGNTEMATLYDTIMQYDRTTNSYTGRTAASLTPNADFTVWTLVLRSGIKFSDGTDYDAEAVVFGLKRHTQFASRSASLVGNIKEYKVLDKLSVEFTLTGRWASFPYVLAYAPGMIPSPTAVRAACGPNQEIRPRECGFNLKPVGAGPFVLDSYKPKDSITVKRNDAYWGGEVYLDAIKFVLLVGAPATYEALKSNTLQSAFLREAEVLKRAKEDGTIGGYYEVKQSLGGVVLMNNGKVTCRNGNPAGVCTGKPDGVVSIETPTADRRVRQAIAYAVDTKVLDQRLNNGTGYPGEEFFQEGSRWKSRAPVSSYDPAKAKELVEQVKRETGWDGSLRVNCHNAQSTSGWPISMEAMLSTVGFKPRMKYDYDLAAMVNDVTVNKAFDIACFGFSVDDEAPEVGLQQNLSSSSSSMNLSSPELDAQIRAVREAATEPDKLAALEKVQDLWRTEQFSKVWRATGEMIAWNKNMRGVKVTVSTTVLFDKAWLS
jgi:peptide/nickel transport system substrate-binding protein